MSDTESGTSERLSVLFIFLLQQLITSLYTCKHAISRVDNFPCMCTGGLHQYHFPFFFNYRTFAHCSLCVSLNIDYYITVVCGRYSTYMYVQVAVNCSCWTVLTGAIYSLLAECNSPWCVVCVKALSIIP